MVPSFLEGDRRGWTITLRLVGAVKQRCFFHLVDLCFIEYPLFLQEGAEELDPYIGTL